MSDTATLQADYKALNDLIVNCPEFEELERLLGGFNLFQVLKFEYGEIRHSNVLAWILDPSESHGLDETFLKKWLMRVIHEVPDCEPPVNAFEIDAWRLLDVEVRREWRSIDLLVILRFVQGPPWVLCIENKVNSTQHSNQLTRYREIVESEFPDARHRIYFFLTKSGEPPDDEHYISAAYAQIHRVLKECVAARSHMIGTEPKALLENYISLLEEKFMDQSKIAEIARTIYKQHRRALDVLFEHRPDNLLNVSDTVRSALAEKAGSLGIVIGPCNKGIVRFIPMAWDQPGNRQGNAWSGDWKGTVLFEINLRGPKPKLYVISGRAPDIWADSIWKKVLDPRSPFSRVKSKSQRPKDWITLHFAGIGTTDLEASDTKELADVADEIVGWLSERLAAAETVEVIKAIASELPKLQEAYRSHASA